MPPSRHLPRSLVDCLAGRMWERMLCSAEQVIAGLWPSRWQRNPHLQRRGPIDVVIAERRKQTDIRGLREVGLLLLLLQLELVETEPWWFGGRPSRKTMLAGVGNDSNEWNFPLETEAGI
jgi:hypothetical protein